MKTVLIVDGQGGGLGKALVEKLREAELPVRILAAGTNSRATGAMLKAGAEAAATGENAVVYNAGRADVVMGGAGILCANAMMGEITPAMAAGISASGAIKLLVPWQKCRLRFAGVQEAPLPQKLEAAVESLREILRELGESV